MSSMAKPFHPDDGNGAEIFFTVCALIMALIVIIMVLFAGGAK